MFFGEKYNMIKKENIVKKILSVDPSDVRKIYHDELNKIISRKEKKINKDIINKIIIMLNKENVFIKKETFEKIAELNLKNNNTFFNNALNDVKNNKIYLMIDVIKQFIFNKIDYGIKYEGSELSKKIKKYENEVNNEK